MEQLSEKDCFVLSVRPLKGQTICSPNVRLGKGKHGPVDAEPTETKAQVKDVTCQPLSSNYSAPKTLPDCKQYISSNNRPSWNIRKINGHLLPSINLSLKMLWVFLVLHFFLSLCCRGNWILPSGTAAGSDCALQSGGSYLSLGTRCCSSPGGNKLQSTVDTEKREKTCACMHKCKLKQYYY